MLPSVAEPGARWDRPRPRWAASGESDRAGDSRDEDVRSDPLARTAPPDERAEPTAPFVRGEHLGRYLLLGEIGSGGMGVVYRAYDPELNRKVALKLLRVSRPERAAVARARLQREAKTLARFSHPNVVSVYDVGQVDEHLFVAMEYLEGRDASRWLREAPRPWTESLPLLVQAGRGLVAAHAASLVHRDFKPSNVLVAADGRVAVSDFGLARMDSASQGDSSSVRPTRGDLEGSAAALAICSSRDDAPLDAALTRRGRTVGTPAYMAPEQHAGDPATAAADQYAFCVALYEALYGERPFVGRSAKWLAIAKREGLPSRPATRDHTGRRIPRVVRRALSRGLQCDAKDRFPTLADLLAQLDPARRNNRRLASITAGTATVVLAAYGTAAAQPEDSPCTTAATHIAPAWDDVAAEATRSSFAQTGLPYAARTADTVIEALDATVAAWARSHRDACEATWVRGEQSERTLDLRMACLGRQRQAIGAVRRIFADADATTVDHAAAMVMALPRPERCDDPALVVSDAPDPVDGLGAARVAAVREALVEVQALRRAGRHDRARRELDVLLKRADGLTHLPTVAELLITQGMLQDDAGEFEAAAATLRRAAVKAREGRFGPGEATAWIALMRVTGSHLHDPDRGRFFGDLAMATIATLPAPAQLRAWALSELGELEMRTGDTAAAAEHLSAALALQEQTRGPSHVDVGETLGRLAGVQLRQGDAAAARQGLLRTVDIYAEVLGEQHPRMAAPLGNLGMVLAEAGEYDAALVRLRAAKAILDVTFGGSHPAVANAHDTIGEVLSRQEHHRAARREFAAALAMYRETLGPDHPAAAAPLLGLGRAALALDEPGEARAHLEAAHAMTSHAELPPSQVAQTALALADALEPDDTRVPGLLDEVERAYAKYLPPADPAWQKLHARIASQGGRWVTEPKAPPAG